MIQLAPDIEVIDAEDVSKNILPQGEIRKQNGIYIVEEPSISRIREWTVSKARNLDEYRRTKSLTNEEVHAIGYHAGGFYSVHKHGNILYVQPFTSAEQTLDGVIDNVQRIGFGRLALASGSTLLAACSGGGGGGGGPVTPVFNNPNPNVFAEVFDTPPSNVPLQDASGNPIVDTNGDPVTAQLIFESSNPVALGKDYFTRINDNARLDMEAILNALDASEEISGVAIPFVSRGTSNEYGNVQFHRIEITDPVRAASIGNLTDTNGDGTVDYISKIISGEPSLFIPQSSFNSLGDYVYLGITEVDADTLLNLYVTSISNQVTSVDKQVIKLLGNGNIAASADILYNTQNHGIFSDIYIFEDSQNRLTNLDIQTLKDFYSQNGGRSSQNIRVMYFTDDLDRLDPANVKFLEQAINLTSKNVDKSFYTPEFDK